MIAGTLDLSSMTRCFGDIQRRAGNWRKPLTQCGGAVTQNFEAEWAAHGPGWAPNAKGSTALYVSGTLFRSFTKKGAKGNLFEVGPMGARFGSTLSYAAAIQNGGPVALPSGAVAQIAARPIVRDPSQILLGQFGRFGIDHFRNLEGSR